ncbi:GAP family protein [Kribbella sp. NPDC004875]|uniref:GAP family protein n=1 Tax=Kribbella sp. NPDC004875 TaxID=3364107 RepID=UPI0036B8CE56
MTFDLILIGLAITLEPLPMSGYILLLLSPQQGTRKGLGFLLGWLLTLVGLVVLTLVFTSGKPPATGSTPSTAVLIIKILLGIALLAVAWRTRKHRGRPTQPPRWMAKVDDLGFFAAMGIGFLLQPWPLVAAGVTTVASADLSNTSTIVTLTLFCLLASASYLSMQTYVTLRREPARARLDALNRWLGGHRDQVVIAVAVTVGLWLIGKSVFLLAT